MAVCAKHGTSNKALIWESCALQNGLELKSLGVKIDSSLLPAVVSADFFVVKVPAAARLSGSSVRIMRIRWSRGRNKQVGLHLNPANKQ